MTDVAVYGVSWISDDLRHHHAAADDGEGEVRVRERGNDVGSGVGWGPWLGDGTMYAAQHLQQTRLHRRKEVLSPGR